MNLKKISTDSLQKQYDSHYEWCNQEAEALREKIEEILYRKFYLPIYNLIHRM